MKKFTEPLKNVILETEIKKDSFSAFISHFNTLQKANSPFYSWDNRNVDYNFLQGEAKKAGIKKIPTQEELSQLI